MRSEIKNFKEIANFYKQMTDLRDFVAQIDYLINYYNSLLVDLEEQQVTNTVETKSISTIDNSVQVVNSISNEIRYKPWSSDSTPEYGNHATREGLFIPSNEDGTAGVDTFYLKED